MARKRYLFLHYIQPILKGCKRFILFLFFLLGLMLSQISGLPSSAKEPVTTQIFGTLVASVSSQPAATGVAREREKARALNREGSRLLAMGNPAEALKKWEEAEELYRKIGDRRGIIGSGLNQAQALEALGHYTRSCDRILAGFGSEYKCEELTENNLDRELDRFQVADKSLNFKGLQSLGNMLRRIGKLEESQEVLRESKDKVRSPERLSQAWLNLGNTVQALGKQAEDIDNTVQAKGHYEKALECYQKAVLFAKTQNSKLPAQVNLLNLKLKVEKAPELSIDLPIKDTRDLLSEVKEQLDKLRPSQMTVYAKINLACSLIGCDRVYAAPGSQEALQWARSDIEELLKTAIKEANILQNKRFQSLAIGTFGTLYEEAGELREAERMTEEALELAKAIEADDIAYQWEWQMGRLLKQEGDVQGAIAYYREAFETLNLVRWDLLSINDVEFSFRLQVDPVYRELVDLLLLESDQVSDAKEKESLIEDAVEVMDSLRLAELEIYLDCNLLNRAASDGEDTKPVPVEEVDEKAALIYPIILPDRLEIIFKMPGEAWKHRSRAISNMREVQKTLAELQEYLKKRRGTEEVQKDAQKVYDWLIKPIEEDLENLRSRGKLTTLVFGLDDSLRNIPMAVLYNKGKYLIEKYAIAVILSRELFEFRPQQQKINVLTAGVEQEQEDVEGKNFEQLEYVRIELEKIQHVMDLPKDPLLNDEFTQDKLEEQIDSAIFPIVHIATHGKFSSDPDETFILAWDELIKVKEFEKILQISDPGDPDRSKAIELLVLSACETAQGNRRAALGLAGVAVQARVRSTVATLWKVDDLLTSELMVKFYEELKDGKNIAEALRQAQLFILQTREKRTYFWASFIVVGNWQSLFGI